MVFERVVVLRAFKTCFHVPIPNSLGCVRTHGGRLPSFMIVVETLIWEKLGLAMWVQLGRKLVGSCQRAEWVVHGVGNRRSYQILKLVNTF